MIFQNLWLLLPKKQHKTMSNDIFAFKKFSIRQEKTAMKVGTDSVILGAYVARYLQNNNIVLNNKHASVLDVGTGTGILALICAQNLSSATIEAIEIDHDAALQAQENVIASPWNNRIKVIESSFKDYAQKEEIVENNYNLIITNPPFYNATLKPEDDARATARHYDSLPFSEIAFFGNQHLTTDGIIAVIYPTNFEENITNAIIQNGLFPRAFCDICTKEGKQPKRRIAILGHPSLDQEEIILDRINISDREGNYTEQFKELTKDYYLNF